MKTDLSGYTFLIPARKGSKGVPYKNRKLINKTIDSIPIKLRDNILISTDDEVIKQKYNNLKIHNRSEKNSQDISSMKDLMLEIKNDIEIENIILLYTTYPERTFKDILDAVSFYEKNNSSSLLCKKELNVSPFLMMYESGIKGKQIIKHNLYRRQDYPKCFEISHFVCVFSMKELNKLNNNLYNEDTIFYPIEDVIDVDTHKDLEKYNEKN